MVVSNSYSLTPAHGLAHWKFLYFHGQKNARINRHRTVYRKSKRERSLLITLLSPALFLAPDVYLGEIQTMWTDKVIIKTIWQSFMAKSIAEWQGLILWVWFDLYCHGIS
jgi:hypothetical protein